MVYLPTTLTSKQRNQAFRRVNEFECLSDESCADCKGRIMILVFPNKK